LARPSARTRAVASQQPGRAATGNGTRNARTGTATRPARTRPPRVVTPSRWRQPVAFALSSLALADAVYLTIQHYTNNGSLACSSSGVIDCAKVLTSPQAVILGVPVAVIGLAYYAVMFLLNTPYAWRTTLEWVAPLRLLAIFCGMGMVLYLISVEVSLRTICEYCTLVHILTFALFVILVTGWEDTLAYRGAASVRRSAKTDAPAEPDPDAA
jgi:uncharacterized membrane protein